MLLFPVVFPIWLVVWLNWSDCDDNDEDDDIVTDDDVDGITVVVGSCCDSDGGDGDIISVKYFFPFLPSMTKSGGIPNISTMRDNWLCCDTPGNMGNPIYISTHTQANDHISMAPLYGNPNNTSGARSVSKEDEAWR